MKLSKLHETTLEGVLSMKRNNRILMFLFFISFLGMLYVVHVSLNRVVVISRNGQIQNAKVERRENVIKNTLQLFCKDVNRYANTINRFTVQQHLTKLRFLMSNQSIQHIVDDYRKNRYYANAKNQGLEYKNSFLEFKKIEFKKEPYYVEFLSKTTIFDGKNIQDEFFILSKGYITETTPQLDENNFGFFFSDFNQEYFKNHDKN